MSSTSKLVLVTGVTGFLGSHVAVALINAGYAVRGNWGTTTLSSNSLKLIDVTTSDFREAFEGVYAVIHVTSLLAGQGSPDEVLDIAIEGKLNVLRPANGAGIKKVVLTSSWAATIGPKVSDDTGKTFTEADWGEATKEEAISLYANDPMKVYSASKVLSESAAWDFAAKTPEFDFATIIPPWLFGPYVHHFPQPSYLGPNGWLYIPLQSKKPPIIEPQFADIRDAARAHVAALGVPPVVTPEGGRNRQARDICSGEMIRRNVLQLLHEQGPELKDRLTYDGVDVQAAMNIKIDVTRAEEDLGIKEWTSWKKTLLDVVESLLEPDKHRTI